MRRNVIFRGKVIDEVDRWVEGSLVVAGGMVAIFTVEHGSFHVESNSVGQWTGRFDRKGQRIFEGDILEIENEGVYLCIWDDGNLEFSFINRKESFGMAYAPLHEATVLGTIYDNLELLEAV